MEAPQFRDTVSVPPYQGPVMSPLEHSLVRALGSGHTALPVLPHVAAQALHLAGDPEASIAELATLIEADPPIAARFLSVANSAAYNRGWPATSAQSAVTRLGLAATRDLLFQVVYAAATRGLKRYEREVRACFTRSVLAGQACKLLCRELDIRYEYDYMCGLLHDIGEARVYRVLSTHPMPEGGEAVVRDLVHRYHTAAGAEVARAWRLPGDLVDVCAAHHEPLARGTFHVRLTMMADLVVSARAAAKSGAPLPTVEELREVDLSPRTLAHVLESMGRVGE